MMFYLSKTEGRWLFSSKGKVLLDLGKERRRDGRGSNELSDRLGWEQVTLHKFFEEVANVTETVRHIDHMLLQVSKQVLESATFF